MEVLYAVCCGLDVHKANVTACLRSPGTGPPRRQEVRAFATTTGELLRLVDWLTAAGCTHVAVESTGESTGGRSTISSRDTSSCSWSTRSM